MSDGTLPAPAWYDDPTVPGQQRWWDGAGWTEHVQQAAPPEPEPQPAWLTQEFATPAPATQSFTGSYAPMSSGPAGTGIVYRDIPSRWGTVSVWLLALLPWDLLIILVLAVVILVQTGVLLDPVAAFPIIVAVYGAAYLLPLVWAIRDRDVLRQYGYDRPAHFAWIFLSPLAYLIARFVRTRSQAGVGGAPLWVHIASIVVYLIAGVAYGLSGAGLPAGLDQTAVQLELGIEQGFAEAGIVVEAECPDDTTFVANEKFSCVLNRDDGTTAVLTGTWGATRSADPSFEVPQFLPAP